MKVLPWCIGPNIVKEISSSSHILLILKKCKIVVIDMQIILENIIILTLHHLWYLLYMHIRVTYPILRYRLGYANNQQLHH